MNYIKIIWRLIQNILKFVGSSVKSKNFATDVKFEWKASDATTIYIDLHKHVTRPMTFKFWKYFEMIGWLYADALYASLHMNVVVYSIYQNGFFLLELK